MADIKIVGFFEGCWRTRCGRATHQRRCLFPL